MTDNVTTGKDNTDNTATSEGNTDNATTGEDSTVHVHLPPCSSGKAKHPSQIKISSKHTTAIAEPSIDDPLPDSQATVKASGHTLDLGDIGIYELLIQGAPNPPDLEGIEEDQLLEIQQNIQDKWKQRDEERERNITKRMKQYEEKYDFINKALVESIMHITEMTKTDHPMVAANVKSADKIVIRLPHLKDLDQKIPSFPNCDNYEICRASNPNPLNDDTRTNDNEYINSYVEHLRLIICRKWALLLK